MRRVVCSVALCLVAVLAQAKEYGRYDISSILSVSEAPGGQHSVRFNLPLLDQILDDIGSHAEGYPPHFDSVDDRQRAEHDVSVIASLLDPLAGGFSRNTELLLRMGYLHTLGHNLDLAGSAQKAVEAFTALLALAPDDRRGNFRYGMFLATTTKVADAIPYLEKAKSLGVVAAEYPLGMAYTAVGERAKALENLESYSKRVPGDGNVVKVIDAVRKGNIEIKNGNPGIGGSR
jgi:tetratricopeptide (TPR) repeat protein